MAIDRTATLADNLVLKEKLKITFAPDSRKIAIVSRLFYDKAPVLFRKCAGENVAALIKGIDYKLTFKVPGMRSADGLFSVFAGVEILAFEEDSEYYLSYRSLGASANYAADALRVHFEQYHEVHLLSFHALVLSSGGRPTDVDLENSTITLNPATIGYGSSVGIIERDAEENRLTSLITQVAEEGSADGGISDGGMF